MPAVHPRLALLALALVVFGWVVAGLDVRATFGARTTADEPQYLLTARSLGHQFDLDISDELARRDWEAFHSPAELPTQTKVLADGRQVSPHDPLLPLALAVPVRFGGWRAAKVVLAAVAGALAAAIAWVAQRRLGVPQGLALAGAGLFVGAAPSSRWSGC